MTPVNEVKAVKLTGWTLPASAGGRDYDVTFNADGSALRVVCRLGGVGRRGKQYGEGSGRLSWAAGKPLGVTAACAIRAAYQQALRRASALMNAQADTPEAAELDALADFCVAYEGLNFPLAPAGRAALQQSGAK